MKRTKSAILFQGTVELGLVREADLDSEKLRNRFIEKYVNAFKLHQGNPNDQIDYRLNVSLIVVNSTIWHGENRERN